MNDYTKIVNESRIRRFRMRVLAILCFAVAAVLAVASAHAADARLMLDIMACESAHRSDATGDDGVSRGIAQFQKATFYEFATMAKKQGEWDKSLGRPRWLNAKQQVFLLEWGLDNGYGNRWTCYRKLRRTTK